MNTAKWLVPAILSLSVGFVPAVHAQSGPGSAVRVAGTVSGPAEDVSFSGTAQIDVQKAADNFPNSIPRFVVSITLVNVSGRGLSTGATYALGGETTLIRQVVGNDVLEVTFPFFVSGSAPTARAGTALATFSISCDSRSGRLLSAKASLSALKRPAN